MRKTQLRAALSLCLLALTACLAPTASPPAEAAAASGNKTLERHVGERSYRLFVPAGGASQPRPLIVALHGGWGTGLNMQEISGLDTPAGAAGFLVAYPDGLLRSWNAGSCCKPAMEEGVDDLAFVRAVVEDVAKDFPLARTRVFGVGFSNGAMMVNRVACEAPELFAAIAPVAGGLMTAPCKSGRPVSALMIQGFDDPRIPYTGGVFEGNFRPALRDVALDLGARNGCGSGEQPLPANAVATCTTLSACPRDVEVIWCGLAGVGHQWPGGRSLLPQLLGNNTDQYNAAQEIVRFFQRH